MTEQPFNVRIKVRGVDKPFTWTNVFATTPMEAVHRAFDENYWPDRMEYAPEPLRLTVTVTEVISPLPPPSDRELIEVADEILEAL